MKRSEAIIIIANDLIRNITKKEREDILMDWWSAIEEEDSDFVAMPISLKNKISESLKKEIVKNSRAKNPSDKRYDPLIMLGIYYDFRGVRNQYLASEIERILNQKPTITGAVEKLEKCPCCEYYTLDAKCDWDICKVCFWEYDCTTELNKISGPNHITLGEGRVNFQKFGACDQKSINSIDKNGHRKYLR